ncbi:hypothetical protein GCM10022197_29930 [Microlunatus spumicola]|uniref:DUF3152 domain-containing protein n=1 Tax=Microlunatus spumicola TaxID=81499 RepID=A0ABP6XX55_9ACTN
MIFINGVCRTGDWASRWQFGLTTADLLRETQRRFDVEGQRLVELDSYVAGGQRLWSAVWRSGDWAHRLTVGRETDTFLAETQALFDREGLRLERAEVFLEGGRFVWAGSYRSGDWAHRFTVGRDTDTFLAETQAFFDREGLRLTQAIPCTAPDGSLRWAGIYVGGDWAHRFTLGQDQNTFARETQRLFDAEGLRLDQLVEYEVGGTTRYAGIYTPSGDAHRFFLGWPVQDFAAESQRLFEEEGLRITAAQVTPRRGKGVRLQLKILDAPSVPIPDMLRSMREVYASVGQLVTVEGTENLNLPLLTDLDAGGCGGTTTTEQDQLFANRNNVGADDITVYFCRSVTDVAAGSTWNGCATHPDGQPGAAVSSIATRWTLAHEVGHVLGLRHCDDAGARLTDRLMTGGGTGSITNLPPDLDASESSAMDASALTVDL